MNIYPDHYAYLKQEIKKYAEVIPSHKKFLAGDPRIRQFGSIEKLLRFDVLHICGLTSFVHKELYMYLDALTIDDSVRKVLKELNVF